LLRYPALLLDQDAVHDRDLARGTAEAQRRHTQPGLEGLAQRDTVLRLPSLGDRELSQDLPRCGSQFSDRGAFERQVLSAFLPKVLVEVVEHFGPACEALRVIAGRGADPFHKRSVPATSVRPNLPSLRSISWMISAMARSATSFRPHRSSNTSKVHLSPSCVNSASNMSKRSSPSFGR